MLIGGIMQTHSVSKELVSKVQLLRIRVATAYLELKDIREQARQAKRRQREVKRIARRARKQFKKSKDELAELTKALAKAESKLRRAGGGALIRKLARPGTDVHPTGGKSRSNSAAPTDAPEHAPPKQSAIGQSATLPQADVEGAAFDLESPISQTIDRSDEDHEEES